MSMDSIFRHMLRLFFLACMIFVSNPEALAAPAEPKVMDANRAWRVGLVKELYKNFDGRTQFITTQNIKVLEKYFTKDLARSIYWDNDCVKKSKKVCAIDFDLIYWSQDVPATIDIMYTVTGNNVNVRFMKGPKGVGNLQFMFSPNPDAQDKIYDIRYPNGNTLRGSISKFSSSNATSH